MDTTISPIINSEELRSKTLTPINWLWEGVIAHRTITAIAGDAGSYKTFFIMHLAQAIANGEPFLERKTGRNRVVIFDKENCEPLLQQRLQSSGASRYFDIYPKWTRPESPMLLDEKGDVNSLYLDYAAQGYLMMFDSLSRFHQLAENSAKSMCLVTKGFQQLQDAGATVIFTHHTGKGKNDYRGSSEIKAGVDCLFTMRSKDRGFTTRTVLLDCVKHRFVDDEELSILLSIESTDSGLYFKDVSSASNVKDDKEKLRVLELIVGVMQDYYKAHGEYPNQTTIVMLLKDIVSKDTVRDELVARCNSLWTEKRRGKREIYYEPIIDLGAMQSIGINICQSCYSQGEEAA